MDFNKIRRDAGRAYTTKALFTSTRVWRYVKIRQDRVTDSFGIPRARLKMLYSEESNITAFTNSMETTINAGNVLFKGSEEDRLKHVFGVDFHELGHRLFTNFQIERKYVENLRERKGLYPSAPPVFDATEAAKLQALQDMLNDRNKSRIFQEIFLDFRNILEDGRIERMLFTYVENADRLKEGLEKLRERVKNESLTLSEQEDRVSEGKIKALYALMDMSLYYARFEEIKGYDEDEDEPTPLAERLIDIASYIQDYVWADNTLRAYEALNSIFVELQPEIEEVLSVVPPEEPAREPDKDSSSEEETEKDSGDSSEKSSGSSSEENSETDEKEESSGITEEELEEIAKSLASEMAEAVSGTTPEPEDMDTTGSEEESVKDSIEAKAGVLEHSSEESSRDPLTHADGDEADKIPRLPTKRIHNSPGETTHQTISSNPIAADLDVLREDVIKEEADKIAEAALESEYDDIIRHTDFGECHKGATLTLYRINDGWDRLQKQLECVEKDTLPIAKAMAKKSDFFEKDREDLMVKGLYTGKKFVASRTARGNYKYFSKKKGYDEPISLAVSVVIDESGSMCGKKEQAARAFGLILYDYVQLLKEKSGVDIPLNIIGHSSSNIGADVFIYSDAEKPDPRDRQRLMDIQARWNNRDGMPIRLAMKRLEEYPEAQKLLIVVTDGQPAASGYIGTAAEADLRDVANHCEKSGIALMVAAIDADKENIKRIYGAKHFVDIKELDTLSGRVIKVIKNLLAA